MEEFRSKKTVYILSGGHGNAERLFTLSKEDVRLSREDENILPKWAMSELAKDPDYYNESTGLDIRQQEWDRRVHVLSVANMHTMPFENGEDPMINMLKTTGDSVFLTQCHSRNYIPFRKAFNKMESLSLAYAPGRRDVVPIATIA